MNPTAQIAQWSARLPRWQQEALALLATRAELTPAEIEELTQRALAEVGLRDERLPAAAPLPDAAPHAPQPEAGAPARVRLSAVRNASGVNALAPGQTLTFAPQITVIHGRNGAGKSGYARLLAGAAFTRGGRDLLPDVRRPPHGPASAEITLEVDGEPLTFHYAAGAPHPLLARFHLFDGSGVSAQLDKELEVSLTPAPLRPLSRLGRAVDAVRQRIKQCAEARSSHADFAALFAGESAVVDLLRDLNPATDPERLRKLAAVGSEAAADLHRLDREIARLTADSPARRAAALEHEAAAVDALASSLARLGEALPDDLLASLQAQEAEAQRLAEAQAALGAASFAVQGLTQTGTPTWRAFVQNARALALAEAPAYPAAGDACLLCGRPLDGDAAGLLLRLWEMLDGAAQRELGAARAALDARRAALRTLDFNLLGPDSLARRLLAEQNPPLLRTLETLLPRLEERRQACLDPAAAAPTERAAPALRTAILQLENLRDRLRLAAEQARAADTAAEITQMEEQRTLLAHRMQLASLLPAVLAALEGLRWAETAARVPTNTAPLTRFHNELFEALVSERYLSILEAYLERLGRPYLVSVETRGRRGATVKRLKLEEMAGSAGRITPGRVLSEGEQRAVALADFLTEAALDDDCCGLILDDPATSLDPVWGDCIARLLADEAARRQVIIFTHDTAFARQIERAAAERGLAAEWHAIRRDPETETPGIVTLHAGLETGLEG